MFPDTFSQSYCSGELVSVTNCEKRRQLKYGLDVKRFRNVEFPRLKPGAMISANATHLIVIGSIHIRLYIFVLLPGLQPLAVGFGMNIDAGQRKRQFLVPGRCQMIC